MNNFPDTHYQLLYDNIVKRFRLPAATAGKLTELFTCRTLSPGEFYLEAGRPIEKIGFIINGVVRIFTVDAQGNECNLVLADEQHFVLGSFIAEQSSDVYIQSITAAEILETNMSSFISLLAESDLLLTFFHASLSLAHHSIQKHLTRYLRLTAKERYLLFLSEQPNMINRIPHYHIASYLGITQTQLSRIRRSLIKKQ